MQKRRDNNITVTCREVAKPHAGGYNLNNSKWLLFLDPRILAGGMCFKVGAFLFLYLGWESHGAHS